MSQNNNNPSPDPDDNYVYTWRQPPEEENGGTTRQLADLPESFFEFFQNSSGQQRSTVVQSGNGGNGPSSHLQPPAQSTSSGSSGSTSKSSSDLEEDFIEGDFVESQVHVAVSAVPVPSPSLPADPPPPTTVTPITIATPTPTTIPTVTTTHHPHLIWTTTLARKLTPPYGPSSCGLTALTHVLTSLNYNPNPTHLQTTLTPSLRATTPQTPLHTYLISRSRAGTTHAQLISAISTLTQNKILGTFFHLQPGINPTKLLNSIATWIDNGCTPMATLNPQKTSTTADAWHHQMVYGVDADSVLMTNPLSKIPIDQFIPQVTSDSVLLIRREDVLKFHQQNYDLRSLTRIGQEWNDLNVLGTTSHILHEEESQSTTIKKTPFLPIPAEYKAGISVFCTSDNPFREALFNFVI